MRVLIPAREIKLFDRISVPSGRLGVGPHHLGKVLGIIRHPEANLVAFLFRNGSDFVIAMHRNMEVHR